MLHPLGKLPPAVYWRRRLIFVVLPALLIMLLVVYLLAGNGGSPSTPAAASTTASSASTSAGSSSGTPAPKTSASGAATSLSPPAGAATEPGRTCTAADLLVQAAAGQPSYPVNSRPDLYLVVTNTSATPCNQDLADPQIVLTVTAGDVRVWGSHDCGIQPGTDVASLAPNVAVRRGIIWSGLTSVPGCTGNRLVAQAGTYDLVAALAGKTSDKVQFQLT